VSGVLGRRPPGGHERALDRVSDTPDGVTLEGAHPRVVMELLGHSTIALTMNTYSHVIPELKRDAANRMNPLLGGSA
jgi:integrase